MGPSDMVASLVRGLQEGDRRAIARLISLVEDGTPEASEVLQHVFPLTGHAWSIGITGPPGAGKSTLISGLISQLRSDQLSVGVIAIDPTSPFSGGALLGDRIRMRSETLDTGVFIRSMATRGHLGGLSLAAPEAMRVLEAGGYEVVIVETVGVGQSEIEVARQANTTVVVLAPGVGDAVQAAKAGILEVADIYCVNKADKEDARQTVRDVQQMLDLGLPRDPEWRPPIVSTVATSQQGVDELWEAVQSHRAWLQAEGRLDARRRERISAEIREIVGERLKERLVQQAGADVFNRLVDEVLQRRLDPYSAAGRLLERLGLR